MERSKSPTVTVPDRRPVAWRRAALFAGALALVLVVAALGLNVGGVRERWFGAGAVSMRIESLAVLPLDNLSGDQAQEYFADGMTDALIGELSRISALKVISRTSVMPYKRAGKPLRQIARELGVDGVIEGSVLRKRSSHQCAVDSRRHRRHIWSDTYQRELRACWRCRPTSPGGGEEIKSPPLDERRLAGPTM